MMPSSLSPPPFKAPPARVIVPMDVFTRLVINLAQASEGIRQACEILARPGADDHVLDCLDLAVGKVGEMERILRICLEES